ncbi:MAG: helix-turn-helix domain-containing protein [Cyanobacterium sp.]
MLKLFASKQPPEVDYNQIRQEELDRISVLLQNKRLSLGWDIESVSSKIHITKTILKAMENGDLSKLPEPVFIKELLKKYSEFLNINIEEEIKNFPTDKNNNQKNKSIHHRNINPLNFRVNFNSKYLYIVYIALLFFSVKSLNEMLQPTPFSTQDIPETQNSQNNTEDNQAIIDNLANNGQTVDNPTIPVVDTNPEQLKVNIKAQDDSWVRVVIDGNTEFEGILTEGSEREWIASREFTIRAGNAGGLLISVNEETPKQIGELGQVEEITLNL